MDDPGRSPQHPFISLIIPARNEEGRLLACLQSLLSQDYPRERMEVLVMDGMSTDRTRALAESFARDHPFVRVLENPGRTAPCALNAGLRQARGKYILRLDAHAEYATDYISQCVRYLELTRAENVGGPIVTFPGDDTWMARCICAITSHRLVVGGSVFRTVRTARYADGCVFGAWPRELFDKIGTFNEALTRHQDNEFNSRILRYGGKIFMTPAIQSRYYNQTRLSGLCRQAFRNGLWHVLSLVANPASFKVRYFAPFAFVMWFLGFGIPALLHPVFGLPLAAGAILYAMFLSAVTVQVGREHGLRVAALVPGCVLCYHLSYGTGTLLGLFRFLVFGRRDRRRAREGSRIPDPAHPPRLGQQALSEEEIARLA